jgi:carbonic anhydrase/acetyltransferase-like protein (isoleucine patch superfamily)
MLGDNATLGNYTTLGKYTTLGNYTTLGDDATLGNWVTLGDESTLGNNVTLGDYATLGDDAVIGRNPRIGAEVKFGKRTTIEGVKLVKHMTMANVDGSGRQIQIYIHTEGILVRAGCFCGSLEEFCTKALSEGKLLYTRVVRSAVESLKMVVDEINETGGW